ncbi:MAG: DNA repair protein RecO [Gammaproteobacteria bacterium]|nr:DNA repair protein RecO [Gammaproteobacteria bacterium]
MTASRRVYQEPAWVLHHRPFRDTSRILDVFSRDHGRLALVARGSRSAKSRLKGVLRPFLPLQLSWIIRSDMGTLTGAEMNGPPISLFGDALMSGYYVNELMLNLLHRHDPQPEVYAAYESAISALNGSSGVAAVLRRFEMDALALLGYALNLDHDTRSGDEITTGQLYEYRVEQGPVAVEGRNGPMIFSGRELRAIARFEFSDPSVLSAAGRLLRQVIAWQLDGKELQSRKVLREIRVGRQVKGQVRG